MSFWKKAGKVAANIGNSIVSACEKSNEETEDLKQKHDGLDDRKLLMIVHSVGYFKASQKEKALAVTELTQRGHSLKKIRSTNRKPFDL